MVVVEEEMQTVLQFLLDLVEVVELMEHQH